MHLSLDCMLKVDRMVLSKGFSSGGDKRCINELGEGQLVLLPTVRWADTETEGVEYFYVYWELFFQVVEVSISPVIKYVLEFSSSAEHVMCNYVF